MNSSEKSIVLDIKKTSDVENAFVLEAKNLTLEEISSLIDDFIAHMKQREHTVTVSEFTVVNKQGTEEIP